MTGALSAAAAAAISAAAVVTQDAPFGYLGAVVLAALGAFTLWRTGSVRAWREVAQARDARIGDLEAQLAELRAELAIPERIEGIIRLMAETSAREDAARAQAVAKIETAITRLETTIREECSDK